MLAPALGLEPSSHVLHNDAESQQNNAKSRQSSALAKSPDTVDQQNSALPQQNPGTSTHEKCVPSVSKNLDEVGTVGPDDKFHLGPFLHAIIRAAAVATDYEFDSVAVAITGCGIDCEGVGWIDHISQGR